jgi:transposase
MTRSRHSEDYKKEAVRLVIQNNRKIKQVAAELGVNHWTLKDWLRQYGKEIHSEMLAGGLKISPEEELRLLKRELADVKEERDILKKAIAVFSRKPKINTFL